MKRLPRVAVIGRPNIGKSTLVNRICQGREAIVHKQPMITRDRKSYLTDWNGRKFYIYDTGGLDIMSGEKLNIQIAIQAKKAIDEADLVVFMVDLTEPVSPLDREIAGMLRKSQKEIIFAGNKWDDKGMDLHIEDYLELGFDYPVKISAQHGRNIGDLLDMITERLPDKQAELEEEETGLPVVSILGRPNTGKSTLFNTFLRQERAIVDEVEGTTRDSIDSIVKIGNSSYRFIDTAGLKKKRKKMDDLEYYSNLRTERAAETSDLALILVDSSAGEVTRQDVRIVEMCIEKGVSVCIVFSKVDLIDDQGLQQLLRSLDNNLRFAEYIPFLKVSSIHKKGFGSLIKMMDKLIQERKKNIPDRKLTEVLKRSCREKAVFIRKKQFRVKFARQLKAAPPSFLVFANMDVSGRKNVRRFVENNLRDEFGFVGTPIFLKFKY